MSEHFKHDDSLAPDQQGLVALIKQLQKQLVFLEKKIDLLISQSSGRPPSGGRHFSKPFRSFDRPRPHSDRPSGDGASGKSFDRPGYFKKHHSGENRGFDYKKKPYGDSGEGSFSPERNFARRQDGPKGDGGGFSRKSKPFSFRRKNRE